MGRPKKNVLLWCQDQDRAADVRKVISTRLLTVRLVRRFDDADLISAALLIPSEYDDELTMQRYRAAMEDVPVLIWDTARVVPEDCEAAVLLRDSSMAVMMDRLLTLCSRKRGPKSATKREAA